MRILVNGSEAGLVDARDRGLAYGDGVFRTLRCEAGRLLAWPRHYARLAADCAALGIACPAEADLLADLAALAPHDAAVKLTVTRGVGARGYACAAEVPATRIVQAGPLPAYPAGLREHGVAVRLCDWPLAIQPGLAGLKHLNRLDQVMARREWDDPALFDGLMANARGELVEGVMTNLYLLAGGTLLTHPLADCGVAGVTRELVLECAAALGIAVELRAFTAEALATADAVLLSNSLAGVLPVARCGARAWHDFAFARRLHDAVALLARQESRPCVMP
ncbi:aminodeoxychorismate lyase [Chitinimonas koreensis]|uniref:aminodeoxychorismate lyase n=1 Tax=Chitinimonas koreensis TaxID=356302 RepID=UPI00041A76AC|nr:aminodeoxychorismate lyase [Chitinimonas koreensis]QNM97838.1 aminodeoxychorismate lyase [Chitinimonas koreensis]